MPHSEAIHTFSRPPEHTVHPLDPRSREAATLGAVGEQLKNVAENMYKGYDPYLQSGAGVGEMFRPHAAEAKNFHMDLHGFWSRSLDLAKDAYTFTNKDYDKSWLDQKEKSLAEIDDQLTTQLTKWEELTSPFADRYDATEIYNVAHELRGTLARAGEKFTLSGDHMPKTVQENAQAAYVARIASALAGIAEQVSARVTAIAGGKAELNTLSRQTQEFAERAAKDKRAETIAAEASYGRDFRKDFAKTEYTVESLTKLREQQLDLSVELLSDNLSPDQKLRLQQELDRTNRALEVFVEAAKKAMTGNRAFEAIDLRGEIEKQQKHHLEDCKKGKDPEVLQNNKEKIDGMVAKLVSIEKQYLKATAKAVAEESAELQAGRISISNSLKTASLQPAKTRPTTGVTSKAPSSIRSRPPPEKR